MHFAEGILSATLIHVRYICALSMLDTVDLYYKLQAMAEMGVTICNTHFDRCFNPSKKRVDKQQIMAPGFSAYRLSFS